MRARKTTGTQGRSLASSQPDVGAMYQRLDDALLKEMLGEPLSEREIRIVQWVRHGGGCASCGPSGAPGHR